MRINGFNLTMVYFIGEEDFEDFEDFKVSSRVSGVSSGISLAVLPGIYLF